MQNVWDLLLLKNNQPQNNPYAKEAYFGVANFAPPHANPEALNCAHFDKPFPSPLRLFPDSPLTVLPPLPSSDLFLTSPWLYSF